VRLTEAPGTSSPRSANSSVSGAATAESSSREPPSTRERNGDLAGHNRRGERDPMVLRRGRDEQSAMSSGKSAGQARIEIEGTGKGRAASSSSSAGAAARSMDARAFATSAVVAGTSSRGFRSESVPARFPARSARSAGGPPPRGPATRSQRWPNRHDPRCPGARRELSRWSGTPVATGFMSRPCT
jgi:hypothetical protein